MDRRDFIRAAGAASLAALAPGAGRGATAPTPVPLLGHRFLTLSIPIRTTPWEVSRDVKILKTDESPIHTLANVRGLGEAFRQGCPGGRLSWSFTLNALEDPRPNYREIRDYVVQCQREFGDEVTYFPAYFPAMYLPRARTNREISEALALITKMVGNGYRPRSIVAGFLSAENMRYLAEVEGIHVAHGVIWSQHGIDAGDADGSPSYPFYPSREHICKPAQGPADFIDCVNLDGWTMDFITARRYGANGAGRLNHNSRRGLGPIETYGGLGLDLGHREVMHTTAVHFDRGFELNGFGWVTSIWEAALVGQYDRPGQPKEVMVNAMRKWISGTMKRWPDTRIVPFGEFGETWRAHHRNNDSMNYRFEATGSGIADSKDYLSIRWFMNKSFRLALLSDARRGNSEKVIDFTRYDLTAVEPPDPTPDHPTRNWSLVNRINQKRRRPQDRPVPLAKLTVEEKQLIAGYYPELL